MSVTAAYDLTRFMNTLDNVFLSLRMRSDDLDQQSWTSMIEYLRSGFLGIVPDCYESGVIWGLDLVELQKGVYSAGNIDPNMWVVSSGTLFDGIVVRNIYPTMYYSCAYKLILPSGLVGANCYAIGSIFYGSGSFTTRMLGQTYASDPCRLIEKSGVELIDILKYVEGLNVQDTDFVVTQNSGEILIGKFIIDIEEISETTSSYTIYGSSFKDWYPIISGLPGISYEYLPVVINNFAGAIFDPLFDSTIAYILLAPVVSFAVWGGSFYTYWTTGGRVLPSNIKYYYNQIYDPDIP